MAMNKRVVAEKEVGWVSDNDQSSAREGINMNT